MADAPARVLLLVNLVVPLVLFMAWVYLLLHIVFVRLVRRPDSPVLWFFSVVTGPLTRPVRALLPPGTPEPRVRTVSLAVYAGLWVAARVLLAQLGTVARGLRAVNVLGLAAVNILSVLAFAAVYGAAAGRLISQGAFLVAVVAVFGAAAAVWLRTERAGARRGDAIARLGRIVAALAAALVAVPVVALMPLFALQSQVPAEAGLDHVISRTMVLLLASAALAGLVNLAGGCVIAGSALMTRWRASARPPA